MDQRLIFVAMMLLILPSIAAVGKNVSFFTEKTKKSVSVEFSRDQRGPGKSLNRKRKERSIATSTKSH